MKGMILAAGEGTRLLPLTADRPKVMLPVGGHPLLAHTLEWLKAQGIREVGLNLYYQPQTILDCFGDGSRLGVKLTYSRETKLLGTAGGVKKLASFFGQDTFVVIYGDVLTNIDLGPLLSLHRKRGGLLTLALNQVDNPTACGIVEVDGEGRVRRFQEKPQPQEVFSHLANAGVYIAEPGLLDFIPPDTFYDFGRDLFPRLLAEGVPFYGLPVEGLVLDIGTPENYRRACALMERVSQC